MDKQGKSKAGAVVLVILLLVGAYFLFGKQAAPPSGGTGGTGGTVTSCESSNIAFTPKVTRVGKSGTNLASSDNNYFILTNKIGSVAANAAATVPINTDLKVMFGENSTAYYTLVKDFNTDCKNPFFAEVELPLAATSLASFYMENADGTINSATNPQPMSADDTFDGTVTVKAAVDTYYGNPNSKCDNVAVVEYDKSVVQSVKGKTPASVPGFFTYFNATYDGSNGFVVPKTADGVSQTFNMQIASTSTDPTSAYVPVKVHLYDCDIDKNEDSFALIEGVEDEDFNSIALATQALNVWLS